MLSGDVYVTRRVVACVKLSIVCMDYDCCLFCLLGVVFVVALCCLLGCVCACVCGH